METLLRDARHALRMFRESGVSFVVTAVIALGLGIGANTAIFSLVNTVLLREPPFPKADRIVIFETKFPEGEGNGASPAKFAYWAQQTSVVEDVAAFGGGVMNWTGIGYTLLAPSGVLGSHSTYYDSDGSRQLGPSGWP